MYTCKFTNMCYIYTYVCAYMCTLMDFIVFTGHCQKSLEVGKVEGHQGQIYCNNCYARNFGPKAYGYASSMIAVEPNPHFHVKSRPAAASEARFSGSTSSSTSTPLSPLSPKLPASLDSTASSSVDVSLHPDSESRLYVHNALLNTS